MRKYKIMARAKMLGYVEALNGKEAAEKYGNGEYQSVDNTIERPVMVVLDSDVAPLLKDFRESNELSRREAAAKLGVTRMTLYRLEKRVHKPNKTTLQHMKEAGII